METLAALEPSPFPVISLYLSLTPNQNGRESHEQFVRKVFSDRAKALPAESPERESFEKDAERIRQYLDDEKQQSWQGLAIFACSGAELFEAIPLETPFDDHWLFVGSSPHLYPLAKLVDTYPRYAAVSLDTNKARIQVFSLAAAERDRTGRQRQDPPHLEGRLVAGALSAPRRQHPHESHEGSRRHARQGRARGEASIRSSSPATTSAVAKLREQLPQQLADKIVDVVKLQRNAQDASFLETTFDAIRMKDAETDAEKVAGAAR